MERTCDHCGTGYLAKTKRSRYCSDVCRAQQSRSDRAQVIPIGDAGDAGLVRAVRAELVEAQRDGSTAGQQAIDLAVRIAASGEASSAIASLHRELRMMMDAALAQSQAENVVDELRKKRLEKARGA